MTDDYAPQRRLEGEELEKARREVRWLDPEVSGLRIALAGVMPGTHIKPRLTTPSKAMQNVVTAWERADLRKVAYQRSQEVRRKNKAAA